MFSKLSKTSGVEIRRGFATPIEGGDDRVDELQGKWGVIEEFKVALRKINVKDELDTTIRDSAGETIACRFGIERRVILGSLNEWILLRTRS